MNEFSHLINDIYYTGLYVEFVSARILTETESRRYVEECIHLYINVVTQYICWTWEVLSNISTATARKSLALLL